MEIGRGDPKLRRVNRHFFLAAWQKGASTFCSRSVASVQNSKFKIRDSGFRNRESKFKIYDK